MYIRGRIRKDGFVEFGKGNLSLSDNKEYLEYKDGYVESESDTHSMEPIKISDFYIYDGSIGVDKIFELAVGYNFKKHDEYYYVTSVFDIPKRKKD